MPEPVVEEHDVTALTVLFEDHLVPFFRPLTWTQPLFEIRCGIYNTRERIEALDRVGPGKGEGILAGRRQLGKLSTAQGWQWVTESDSPIPDRYDRVLLLNGRTCPDADALRSILNAAEGDFAFFDQDGLLVARVGRELAERMLSSWRAWETRCHEAGCWLRPGVPVEPWIPRNEFADLPANDLPGGTLFGGDVARMAESLSGWTPLRRVWEIVPRTAAAIDADVELIRNGASPARRPFGLVPEARNAEPLWRTSTSWSQGAHFDQVHVTDPQRLWTGNQVEISPFVSIDTSHGPVVLDCGVVIQSQVRLEGPLYVGPMGIIKAGARIYGETSFGVGCRVAGEIGESTFGDFSNKQHAGFIGHAVLGSWVNLGALTTCSDLKNNYGNIRVDLGDGSIDTGLRFVGLMMGDHTKTAIGTMLNTGTCIGVASNVFGGAMPPKWVDSYSWGGQDDSPVYSIDRALKTAEVVLSRRGCRLTDAHRALMESLAR